VMRPVLPRIDSAIPRLREIDASGRYSNFGPQERELRERFGKFFGVGQERIATASNATVGLLGAISISGEKNWLVPSFSFPASPAAVLTSGNHLAFGDIGNDWWLCDTPPSEGGLLSVAPFGSAIDLERFGQRQILVVDGAASMGSELLGIDIMRESWSVVYSLHATKVLGAGEGAVVVFGSGEAADEFRHWTNFGFSKSRESTSIGINGKMSEFQAAIAHTVLDDWSREKQDWRVAREKTYRAQCELGLLGFVMDDVSVNPYWIVTFPDETTTRNVEHRLSEQNIETRRWWGTGCHRMLAYRKFAREPLPNTDKVGNTYLGLPFFRGITQSDIDRIAEVLQASIKK